MYFYADHRLFYLYIVISCTHGHAIIIPHAQLERDKMIGFGVQIYIYVCGPKICFNHTLEIDSPFPHSW